ncbi:MAG TPA: SdrD B-like domain-containing protein, partial [Ilumatobacteraceae bacterium]|nr:SdrD B-like domain-containing protein [Ilumatobacteraceae bacterium]
MPTRLLVVMATLAATVVTGLTLTASPASAAALITGTVIDDANADGVVNTALGTGAEVGLAGVTVELVDDLGNVLDSAITDAMGAYSLDADGYEGDARIRVTTPAGWVVGTSGAGSITR